MEVSQQRRSNWLYVVLAVVLLATAGILTLPVINQILSDPSSRANQAKTTTLSVTEQEELALQAKGYELILQREPNNLTAWQELLSVRLQQSDLESAIALLEEIAQRQPEQTDYQILLAQSQQQVGDYEHSAQTYRTILSNHPNNIKALQGIVNLLLQQNRPQSAIGLLQDTLENMIQANTVQPEQVEVIPVQLLLGQVYTNQARYSEAFATYDQAIATKPEDFRPVLAKALVLQQQGQIAEANPLFQTAVSLAPARYKDQIEAMITSTPTPEPTPVETTP